MTDRPKVAVVTGANRGLGLETCRQLAEKGWSVVLTARRQKDAVFAASDIPGDVHAHELDVTSPKSTEELLAYLKGRHGAVDAWVNNAGVSLDGFDARVAVTTMTVNFFSVVEVTDRALPLLGEHGVMVMVSSGLGQLDCLSPELQTEFGSETLTRQRLHQLAHQFVADVKEGTYRERGWPESTYRVSKVCLNAYTRILARELEGTGKLVNAVSPGWVRTRMGGPGANRTVREGASGIVWAATLPQDGPSGGFFRDAEPLAW